MARVKCPKCGSTAQVELTWIDTDSYSTTTIKEYECGCGCAFECCFDLAHTKILNEN